jgi:hypothetical protein
VSGSGRCHAGTPPWVVEAIGHAAVRAVHAARLRKALVGVAAGDRPGIIARLFDDLRPDPQ